jgi:hypothetical protein
VHAVAVPPNLAALESYVTGKGRFKQAPPPIPESSSGTLQEDYEIALIWLFPCNSNHDPGAQFAGFQSLP